MNERSILRGCHGKNKTLFEYVDWVSAIDDDITKQMRAQLFDIAHELIADIATHVKLKKT